MEIPCISCETETEYLNSCYMLSYYRRGLQWQWNLVTQLGITSNYNFTQIMITHTSLLSLLQPPISLPGYNLLTWCVPHALKARKLPQIGSGYTALVQTAYKYIPTILLLLYCLCHNSNQLPYDICRAVPEQQLSLLVP